MIRLFSLVVLLSLSVGTYAQSSVRSADELHAALDESDKSLGQLERARKQLSAIRSKERDKRGLTLQEDLQQNFLLPETRKKLSALQASAAADLRAKDLPGAQVNISTLQQILTAEIAVYTAISDYWSSVAGRPSRVDAESGIEPAVAKQIESLSAQFDQQLADRDFVTAMRVTRAKIDELEQRANQEQDQRILASINAGDVPARRSVGRGQKCTRADRTSGSDKPSVRQNDFPRTINYYPPGRRNGPANQTVELFVIVGTDGCADRVFLARGAARPEFDEGALRMAADAGYFPAEKNGSAIRGGLTIRIQF